MWCWSRIEGDAEVVGAIPLLFTVNVLLLRPPRLLLSFHLPQFLIYLPLSFHLAPFLGTGNNQMKQPFLRESLHDTYSEKNKL